MDVGSERPLKLGGLPLLLWGQRDRKREAGGEEGAVSRSFYCGFLGKKGVREGEQA